MKKLTFAVLGMGNRGTAYAGKQLKFPEEMEVVAMADNRRVRLEAANKYLHLPEDRRFLSKETVKCSCEVFAAEGIVCYFVCRSVPTPVPSAAQLNLRSGSDMQR